MKDGGRRRHGRKVMKNNEGKEKERERWGGIDSKRKRGRGNKSLRRDEVR